MPNKVDTLLARAQVGLAFFFSAGFIGCLFVLMLLHNQLDTDAKTLLTGLLGVLGTIITQQSAYFFARHRPPTVEDADVPDPTNPVAGPRPVTSPVDPQQP